MTWREQLLDGSFRGVPFNVVSDSGEFGRRTALHEYPLRDKPFAEDIGRKSRMQNLEVLVIGDDYMSKRDALINATEQQGPGTLVHPYYGEMTVSIIGSCTVRNSSEKGGIANITLVFVESGDFTYPSATTDTASASQTQADATSDAGLDFFTGNFTVAQLPAFVSASALATIGQVLGQVTALARFPLADPLARVALGVMVSGLSAGAPSQLADPPTLGQNIVDVIGGLTDAAPDPVTAVAALTQLAAFTATPALATPMTPSRVAEVTNRIALVQFVGVEAIAQAAASLANVDFDSYDQAIALRDSVTAPIDALMDVTTDDNVFSQLVAQRAAVYQDVATRGADLARIVDVTPAATLPAIVLAYNLYEDPERDTDILARNLIQRPGFVPAGLPVEVLIDA